GTRSAARPRLPQAAGAQCAVGLKTSAEQPQTRAPKRSSAPRSATQPVSTSTSGHCSSPSEPAPSSAPKQRSVSVVSTSRRPAWRRAIPSRRRVAPELLEPVGGTGTDGVGRDPDPEARVAEPLESAQVLGDRLLAELLGPAAAVRDVEEDEFDSGLLRRLARRERLLEADVM